MWLLENWGWVAATAQARIMQGVIRNYPSLPHLFPLLSPFPCPSHSSTPASAVLLSLWSPRSFYCSVAVLGRTLGGGGRWGQEVIRWDFKNFKIIEPCDFKSTLGHSTQPSSLIILCSHLPSPSSTRPASRRLSPSSLFTSIIQLQRGREQRAPPSRPTPECAAEGWGGLCGVVAHPAPYLLHYSRLLAPTSYSTSTSTPLHRCFPTSRQPPPLPLFHTPSPLSGVAESPARRVINRRGLNEESVERTSEWISRVYWGKEVSKMAASSLSSLFPVGDVGGIE